MHDLDRVMFEAEEMAGERGESVELAQELFETDGSSEFDDRAAREVTLASELLEVQNPAELEEFLGNLLRRVAGAARTFVHSDTGRALGGLLRQAARQALPLAPQPDGAGGPGGQSAGRALGMELDGLSQEDREFEVARAFVRFADEATQTAARMAAQEPELTPPMNIAKAAVTAAARRYLPGLLAPPLAGHPGARQRSGRWIRRGNTIVVDGA